MLESDQPKICNCLLHLLLGFFIINWVEYRLYRIQQCWWLKIDENVRVLVAEFLTCWPLLDFGARCQIDTANVRDRWFWWQTTVTEILISSPTHFVLNIRHQHRCGSIGIIILRSLRILSCFLVFFFFSFFSETSLPPYYKTKYHFQTWDTPPSINTTTPFISDFVQIYFWLKFS